MKRARAERRELLLELLAQPGGGRGLEVEVRERRAQIQARPPDDDRRRALGQQVVDLGVRCRRVLGDAVFAVDRDISDQAVLEPLELFRRGLGGERVQPLVHLNRVRRDGDGALAARAQHLGHLDGDLGLPDPGRPEDATLRPTSQLVASTSAQAASAREQQLVAGERRGRGCGDLHVDELAGLAEPGEVDRLVVPRAAAQALGSVRLGPSTRTSCVVSTNGCCARCARRWTTSTSRSIRSRFTAWGSWSGRSAASVPRRGEKRNVNAES